MNTKRVLGLFSLLFISACSTTTNSTMLSEKKYPAKPENCAIRVYSVVPNDLKFEEIALLNATSQQYSSDTTFERLLPHMKQEACKLGADALIVRNTTESRTTWNPANHLDAETSPAQASATAIKIL